MTTLTPQQRQFLALRLKVKQPKKKGFFSRATADEQSDAQVRKDYEQLLDNLTKVEAAIDKLSAMAGQKGKAQAQVQAFRVWLDAVRQAMDQTTDQNAASTFQAQKVQLATLSDQVKAEVKRHEALPESKARGQYAAALADAQRQLDLLKVIPNAQVQALSDLVASAQQAAIPDTEAAYRQALKVLAGCGAEFKNASVAAVKAQKADIAQSSKKPDALTALSDAAARLEALDRLPGCETAATDFGKILKEAQQLAGMNRFADALGELDKLKKLPDLAAHEADSKRKVAQQLAGDKDYEAGIAWLARLRELVTPVAFAEHDEAFQVAVKQALAHPGKPSSLKAAADSLQEAFNAVTQAKAGLGALLADIKNARTYFGLMSSQGDNDRVDEKSAAVARAQTAKDYTTASRLAAELLSELLSGIAAREQPHADWLEINDQPALLVKEIDQLRESAKCEAVRLSMLTLMYKVSTSEVQRLRGAAQWSTLVAHVAQVKQGLTQARAKETAFAAFESTRATAAVEVEKWITQASDAVNALTEAVDSKEAEGSAARGQPVAAIVAFTQRLDQIRLIWAKALASATSDAELGRDAMKARLEALRAEIAAADVKALAKDRARRLAQAQFETDWGGVQSEIVKLQAVDNQAAAQAGAQADAIRQGGPADWHAALGALEKLNNRLAAEREKLMQARDNKAAAVAKTVADVRAQINALKGSKGTSSFGPFFEALQQECDQFELLAKSPNGDAIDEAELGLKGMQARIRKFMPDNAAATNGPTFAAVDGALTASAAALKKVTDVLAANCPKTLARLTQELAALRVALAKQDPEASMKAIRDFDAARVEAEKEAAKVIEVRNDFTALLPSVKAASAAFSKKESAPEYAKLLAQRIEEIVKQAENPDELYSALLKLNAVDEELKDAALRPGAALAKESQLREQKQADALAEAEWKRSLQIFEGQRLGEAQAAVKVGGAKGLIDELKNMLKAAKEAAGRGDHAQALDQLKLADQRATEIIAQPQGASIGARNNLPADAALYTAAVDALSALLARFPQQVAEALPGLPQAVTQRLGERVGGLVARLEPAAFDASVRALIEPGLVDTKRRDLREVALAKVRSTRSLFRSHPLMASLAKSPVAAAELSAALRRIDNALNRLDANISRSCA